MSIAPATQRLVHFLLGLGLVLLSKTSSRRNALFSSLTASPWLVEHLASDHDSCPLDTNLAVC